MLTVSELHIYPIKSLGGISVETARVTPRGLQHDRRWLLVDEANRFITQREFPEMALLQVSLAPDGLLVYHKHNPEQQLLIPFKTESGQKEMVQIWNDECEASVVGGNAAEWFSDVLNRYCRLVYMPDTTQRLVDITGASHGEITSFSDDYPLLMIGQASLDDLNNRLHKPVPMNRFRPNIVFTGGDAFEEDRMAEFTISDVTYYGVKLCARCVVTTINQSTAEKSKEPLKTLASYRLKNRKTYFGQNLIHKGEGETRLGDTLNILSYKDPF